MIGNEASLLRNRQIGQWLSLVVTLALVFGRAEGGEPKVTSADNETRTPFDGASVEFFEKSVRPILARGVRVATGLINRRGVCDSMLRGAILAGGQPGPRSFRVSQGKPVG